MKSSGRDMAHRDHPNPPVQTWWPRWIRRLGRRETTFSQSWSSRPRWRAAAHPPEATAPCLERAGQALTLPSAFLETALRASQVAELRACEPQLKLLHTCYRGGEQGVRGAAPGAAPPRPPARAPGSSLSRPPHARSPPDRLSPPGLRPPRLPARRGGFPAAVLRFPGGAAAHQQGGGGGGVPPGGQARGARPGAVLGGAGAQRACTRGRAFLP